MKKTFLICSLTALAISACGVGGALLITNSNQETKASVGSYSTNASTYYSSITATSGTALLGQLHDLMCNTHQTYTTYADCKNPTYVYATDPGSSSSYIKEWYSQKDIGVSWGGGNQGTWNREHVWCKSLSNGLYTTITDSGAGPGADMQHIRPVESGLNSARNNSPYGVVSTHTGNEKYYEDSANNPIAIGGWKANDVFEPIDSCKGDVARILMYLYTHYNTYSNVSGTTNGSGSSSYFGTLPITNIVYTSAGTDAAAWALLLTWNTADPISTEETTRNNAAASYEGVRNPFIDNSSYANAIWGTGTVTTDPSVSFSSSTASVTVGSTTTVSATVNNGSGTISYAITSGSSYASVNSSTGVVTGIATGTAVVTASVTISGTTYTDTCTVTVSAGSVSISKSSLSLSIDGTSTIYATSSNSSTISWSSNNTGVATVSASSSDSGSSNTITITGVAAGNATITASATIGGTTYSNTCSVIVSASGSSGNGDYVKITSLSDMTTGDYVIAANASSTYYALPNTFSANRISSSTAITVTSDTIASADATNYSITLTASGSSANIHDGTNYLVDSTSTSFAISSSVPSPLSWTVSTGTNGTFRFTGVTNTSRVIAYRLSTYQVFGCYASSNVTSNSTEFFDVELFKKSGEDTPSTDSLTFSPTSMNVVVGRTATIVATASGTVTWSSDDSSIATVNNGVVTGIAAGSTTIRGTCGTASASCAVTVASGSSSSTDYTIVFSTNTSDSTSAYSTSAAFIAGATTNTLVETFTSMTYCYKGKSGVKLGKYATAGSFAFTPVTAAQSNITAIKVTSTVYGSDTGTLSFSFGSQSVTGQTVGTDYTYSNASGISVSSFSVATSSDRAYIGSITFTVGTNLVTTTSVVQDWVDSYLYMTSYISNLGYCSDSTHSYYAVAKSALIALGSTYISEFQNNSTFDSAQARYEAWASANGDSTPYAASSSSSTILNEFVTNNSLYLVMLAITCFTIGVGAYFFAKKKHE